MARGLTAFKRFQISNPENTVGTAEAAVEILYGMITAPTHDQVLHMPEQDRNTLAMHAETPFDVSKNVELEITGELYDRICAWMFSSAIRGNITPAQPDAANQPNFYTWTWEPGLSTANTPDITNGIDTFTIEYGDNIQAYEVEYGFTSSIEITGTVNGPVEFTWTLGGRQVSEVSFTGALTEPTKQFFDFNSTEFYIDTSYAGIGGTQKTGMLRGFTWTFETMFTPLFAADGNLYFSGLNEGKKTVNLELTYYRDDTNSEAEKDKFLAQTLFFPRIALKGDTEVDSGESNLPYLYLDGAFRYTEWPEFDDEDGTSVVTVTAQAYQDPTSSKMMTVTLGSALDAYPS